MGLMEGFFNFLFGGGRNVVRETAEVFRPNAEAGAQRDANYRTAALAQHGAEFATPRTGWFDRFMDGLNRLPRPAMVIGVLALFVSAMVDPIWFATRMQGLALVPEPLWWLLGAIVSFYFGARHQVKGQEFQRSIAETLSRAPTVVANIARLQALRHDSPGVADTGTDAELTQEALRPSMNAAVVEWEARK